MKYLILIFAALTANAAYAHHYYNTCIIVKDNYTVRGVVINGVCYEQSV